MIRVFFSTDGGLTWFYEQRLWAIWRPLVVRSVSKDPPTDLTWALLWPWNRRTPK